MTTSPGTAGNQSLSAPMLSKSGSIFNRNYHSLEAIANALGLPSEGSWKRVFFTRDRWQGNLGGLAWADAKCQAAATARSLGGTWKAVLSSSATDAINRLSSAQTIFNLKWEIVVYNPLGKWLFEQWKAKTNSAQYEIRWPLITDEYWIYYNTHSPAGWTSRYMNWQVVDLQAIHIWTFTTRDWLKVTTAPSSACTDWTDIVSTSSYTYHWLVNSANSFNWSDFFNQTSLTSTSWTPYSSIAAAYNPNYCDNYRSLLCQEQ